MFEIKRKLIEDSQKFLLLSHKKNMDQQTRLKINKALELNHASSVFVDGLNNLHEATKFLTQKGRLAGHGQIVDTGTYVVHIKPL